MTPDFPKEVQVTSSAQATNTLPVSEHLGLQVSFLSVKRGRVL